MDSSPSRTFSELRGVLALSIEALAERAGVEPAVILACERGAEVEARDVAAVADTLRFELLSRSRWLSRHEAVARVRAHLRGRGLSMADVLAAAGLPPDTLNPVQIADQLHYPGLDGDRAEKIAEQLDQRPDWLRRDPPDNHVIVEAERQAHALADEAIQAAAEITQPPPITV